MDRKEIKLQEVKYIPVNSDEGVKLTPESPKKPDTIFLYFTVLLVQLLIVVIGGNVVWTSPALIALESNDTNINPIGKPITPSEVSLIAGIPGLFGLLGTLFLPKLSDIIGVKKHLIVMTAFTILCGVALAFSRKIILMVVSRCLLSIFTAGIWGVIPIYITEICEDHNRSKFGCFIGLFHQIGHFFVFLIGPIFSIQNFTIIMVLPAFIFLVGIFFIPESPIRLLSAGKEAKCKRAIRKFRHNKSEEEREQDLMKLKEQLKHTSETKKATFFDLVRVRENRIALMLALLPLLTQHTSGVSVIMSYLAPFFDAAGTSLSGSVVAVMVSIVKMSCFFFTSLVVEKYGRRRMLLISSMGTSIPLFTLGTFFYLKHINSPLLVHLQWLPLVGILSNVFFYALGLGPVPVAVISELFPPDLRAASGAVIHAVVGITILILTSAFPVISDLIGIHWCVWSFGCCCLIGSLLIYFFLPETKGKSLLEIQKMLREY